MPTGEGIVLSMRRQTLREAAQRYIAALQQGFWQDEATEARWCQVAQVRSSGRIWQRVRSERSECLGEGIPTRADCNRCENVCNGRVDYCGGPGKPLVPTARWV